MTFLVKWQPATKEWDPDPHKPFLVQVLKKAVFNNLIDLEFLFYFKNSLVVMCEVWLKRVGIDPLINTSKNFHILQDEFFKVLAHVNRGFELEVNADWRGGVSRLMALWENIEQEGEALWTDHKHARRKGDPASRFELKDEPKQEAADTFWVSMFKRGRKWKEQTLQTADTIDAQQARFFISPFDIDEHKTFTETKTALLRDTREAWLANTLSSKLGLSQGRDFLQETFASSFKTMEEARKVIREGIAQLWLIRNFFQLYRRDWRYLLGTLTGGHVALERLFGNVIATIILNYDRKSYELKEEDAGGLFRIFWLHDRMLPLDQAERVLHTLHDAVANTKEYQIYFDTVMVLSALQRSDAEVKQYKTFSETANAVLALEKEIAHVVAYTIEGTEGDFAGLEVPIDTEKKYQLLIAKLELLTALEIDIHKVVEDVFWTVTGTFSDLIRAHKIQKKKKLSDEEKQDLRAIVQRHHLHEDEHNFLSYGSGRCYIGKELEHFRAPKESRKATPTHLVFEKKTQAIKKDYLIAPIAIRRALAAHWGRYGKLIADITDKKKNMVFSDAKLIWTPAKIQVTDTRFQSKMKPRTLYEVKIKQALPRKPREKWE